MGKVIAGAADVSDGKWRTVAELADQFRPARTLANDEILIALGRAVMAWNMTESILRLLLEVLVGEEGGAPRASLMTLTAEISGVDLERAIGVLAPHVLDAERLPDVMYAAKLAERVREYRNFYVHGLSWIVSHEVLAVAPVLTIRARGSLKQYRDEVSAADLERFSRWCAEASSFIKYVIGNWYPVDLGHGPPPAPVRPELPPKCARREHVFPPHPRPKAIVLKASKRHARKAHEDGQT